MPKTAVNKKSLQYLIDEDINFETLIDKVDSDIEMNLDDARSNAEDAMSTMSAIGSDMPREYCDGLCDKANEAESEVDAVTDSLNSCQTELREVSDMLSAVRDVLLISVKKLTKEIKTLEGCSKEAVLDTVSKIQEVLDY